LRHDLDIFVRDCDACRVERDVGGGEEARGEMRLTRVQRGVHEDGIAVLRMLADELHVAESIADRYFENFAAHQSFAYLCHCGRFCHVTPLSVHGNCAKSEGFPRIGTTTSSDGIAHAVGLEAAHEYATADRIPGHRAHGARAGAGHGARHGVAEQTTDVARGLSHRPAVVCVAIAALRA